MSAFKFFMTNRFKAACHGKQAHKSVGAAEAHVRSLEARGETGLSTYFCRFCKSWHVGHKK